MGAGGNIGGSGYTADATGLMGNSLQRTGTVPNTGVIQ